VGYSNKSFLSEIPIDIYLEGQGLEIAVAKVHAQQCAHQRTPAECRLFTQFGPSPHYVETSSPFHFVSTKKRTVSEDSDTVNCLLKTLERLPKYCYQSVYCCLIWYFLVRIRFAKWFTNSKEREMIHVILLKTPCSYLQSFSITGVSSGLAIRVTLTCVSQGNLGKSIIRVWICF
jgi:hypothetical protein